MHDMSLLVAKVADAPQAHYLPSTLWLCSLAYKLLKLFAELPMQSADIWNSTDLLTDRMQNVLNMFIA